MHSTWFAIGAALAALSVTAGAFGAHGLRARLTPEALDLWEIAARYAMYAAMALMAVGLAAGQKPSPTWTYAGVGLTAGCVIFSGTVAALALGSPRWFGAITPIGGLLMILGLVAMAIAALR